MPVTPHDIAQRLASCKHAWHDPSLNLDHAAQPDLSPIEWANIASTARRQSTALPIIRIVKTPHVSDDTAIIAMTNRRGQKYLATAFFKPLSRLWFVMPPHRHPHAFYPDGIMDHTSLTGVINTILACPDFWVRHPETPPLALNH